MLDLKKVALIAIIALLIALAGYSLSQTAQQTAEINNIFEIVVNNTNLAPSFAGETPGTNERISGNTYYANTSPIQILLWAHATVSGDTAEIHLFINDTKVLDISGKPLGIAESNNKSISAIIPKGASYKVEFNNYHHYEWREYPILSGKNGTLSINQTTINNIGGGGVSFNGTPVDLNGSILYNGSINHANLTNLNWANTNHTIDTDFNISGYQLKNASVEYGNSFPASPNYGRWFLRNDTGILYMYDGSWKSITSTFLSLNLYVNQTIGSDTSGYGFNITTPCKTITYCLSIVPATSGGDVTIYISNGIYNESVFIGGKDFSGFFKLTLQGQRKYYLNTTVTGGYTGNATLQAYLNFSGTPFTLNQYQHYFVEFTSGNNIGTIRLIDSNDLNSMYLVGKINSVSNGDSVSIYSSNTSIFPQPNALELFSIEIINSKNINVNDINLTRGFQIKSSDNTNFNRTYIINPVYLNRSELFSRFLTSTGTIESSVFIIDDSTGNYLNFWSISSDYYLTRIKIQGGIYGALFRSGYILLTDGSIVNGTTGRGLWVEFNGVVQLYGGNSIQNIFIRNNGVGVYVKSGGFVSRENYVFSSNVDDYATEYAGVGYAFTCFNADGDKIRSSVSCDTI